MTRKRKTAGKQAAKRDPWVVDRLVDVARFFDRSLDTVKGPWRAKGMPGKGGEWDLRLILQWWLTTFMGDEPAGDGGETRAEAERRRAIAEANVAELKAKQAAGELIEVDPVRRLFLQHVHEARSIFVQVPDQVLGCLPATIQKRTRKRILQSCKEIIEDTCDTLADLLTHYTDQPGGDDAGD